MKPKDIQLLWEPLTTAHETSGDPVEFLSLGVYRTKVPGGWLVMAKMSHEASLAFVPDAQHGWDGRTLA